VDRVAIKQKMTNDFRLNYHGALQWPIRFGDVWINRNESPHFPFEARPNIFAGEDCFYHFVHFFIHFLRHQIERTENFIMTTTKAHFVFPKEIKKFLCSSKVD